MADIVNLATFEFDSDRLEANLKKSQDRLIDLRIEQQRYNDLARASQKIINELAAANLKLADAEGDNTDAIEENNKLMAEATEAYRQNSINALNVANNMRAVRGEINQTETQLRAYMNGMGEFQSLQEQANSAIEREIRNKNEARAANLELQKISNQLNPSIAEEAELLTKVNAQIDANTKFIKSNSSAAAQQAMNVGNYKDSVKEALEETGLFGNSLKALGPIGNTVVVGFNAIKEKAGEVKNAFTGYIGAQAEVKTATIASTAAQEASVVATQAAAVANERATVVGFAYSQGKATQTELDAANTAAKVANTAATEAQVVATNAVAVAQRAATKASLGFIATPLGAFLAILAATIGLVVGAFKFVTSSMNSTEQGANKLSKVTATITGVFNGLYKILKPVGEFVGEVLIQAFEDAADVISTTVDLIAAGLDAIGLDSAAAAVNGFSAAAEKGAKDAAALADAEAQLAAANREARITQLQYQKEAEKARQLRDDESKSIPERIAANEKLGNILKEQLAAELAIAKQALVVADLRIKAEGATTEALNQRAEALTNIADIEERITGQQSEQLTNLNSLRKEAADAEKERREKAVEAAKKAAEDMVKAMQLELDFYIESQNGRKKSLEDQIKTEEEIMRQSLAIAQTELDKKLISRKEYDLKVLQAQNEFGARQVELVIDNADKELEAFINANQRKIEEGKFFNDELYFQELDRLNRISEERAYFATLQYQQGIINEREYRDAIAAIDQEYYDAQQAVDLERREAEAAQQAANLALEVEAAGANFDYDLQLQMKQYQAEYDAEKAAAIKNGADMLLFEKNQAEKRKQIEQAVQQNKIQLASNAFGSLAAIAGEESAAGKAFAVAQATIDTYASATSAFNSLSGIPIVGPVLGGIAAAAAVAAGIANVKKILSVKTPTMEKKATPSYASGVIGVRGAGTGTSDSIAANISAGESVMTARATSMFPNTLSAINQAGGGVGLDGELSSTILQNGLQSRADSTMNIEMIAEAVALGAQRGTQQGAADGMIGLAQERAIQQNARV